MCNCFVFCFLFFKVLHSFVQLYWWGEVLPVLCFPQSNQSAISFHAWVPVWSSCIVTDFYTVLCMERELQKLAKLAAIYLCEHCARNAGPCWWWCTQSTEWQKADESWYQSAGRDCSRSLCSCKQQHPEIAYMWALWGDVGFCSWDRCIEIGRVLFWHSGFFLYYSTILNLFSYSILEKMGNVGRIRIITVLVTISHLSHLWLLRTLAGYYWVKDLVNILKTTSFKSLNFGIFFPS